MNITHGASKRDKRLYGLWNSMLHRCENPKREKFKIYGARGISVCEEWHDPTVFMDWAYANGYSPRLQLDRVDNDGNYCPENCRFVTPSQNSCNRASSISLCVNGISKNVSEWGRLLHISRFTIHYWIKTKGASYAEQRLCEASGHIRGKI